MNVKLNDEIQTVPSSASLMEVLRLSSLDEKKGIAVAINQVIVPRALWNKAPLQENDTITVIQATQGG
jgi:sulfur carrier protein